MSQLSKSMPKMRTAYSPRVKSSHNTYVLEQKKPSNVNEKIIPRKTNINPQLIDQQLSKKLSTANSPLKIGKFDMAVLNTQAESPVKYNKFFQNTPVNKKKQSPKQNNNKPFRQFHWPKNEKICCHFDAKQMQNEPKISRCMSAQTYRSAISSRSEKSNRIKEQRKEFDEKFKVAFDYLMTKNSAFLQSKLSMCNQKARPKQQNFSVIRPPINTANKDFYKKNEDKYKLQIEPQNEKVSILLSESKVCGNSTSQQFHKGTPQKRADLAEWSQGFKLQGPIYEATTYSNAYPHHGDFQRMVPIAVWNQHPLGLKHKATTTNSRQLRGEFRSRSQLATWNNLNPVANELFNPNKSTVYGQEFGRKERQGIQKWPMAEHKLITTDGKFNTQMGMSMVNFNSHELNTQNKCTCGRKRH